MGQNIALLMVLSRRRHWRRISCEYIWYGEKVFAELDILSSRWCDTDSACFQDSEGLYRRVKELQQTIDQQEFKLDEAKRSTKSTTGIGWDGFSLHDPKTIPFKARSSLRESTSWSEDNERLESERLILRRRLVHSFRSRTRYKSKMQERFSGGDRVWVILATRSCGEDPSTSDFDHTQGRSGRNAVAKAPLVIPLDSLTAV